MDDCDAWYKYPRLRNWFNKLWVAERMGHKCGPAGTDIPEDGTYVIRPIYNLSGMGVGAHVKQLKAGDCRSVPAGYFWCEYFTGKHYSADYEFVHDTKPYWKPISCWEGTNMPINLTKFVEWKRSDWIPEVPRVVNEVCEVKRINVEFKGQDVIEVHLRASADPQYDHIIPVWASDLGPKKEHMEMHGFQFIEDYDDADGQLDDARIGFLVK